MKHTSRTRRCGTARHHPCGSPVHVEALEQRLPPGDLLFGTAAPPWLAASARGPDAIARVSASADMAALGASAELPAVLAAADTDGPRKSPTSALFRAADDLLAAAFADPLHQWGAVGGPVA